MRSTTLADTYGATLHSIVPENVVAAGVPKSQFTQYPRSPPVGCMALVKFAPLTICVRTVLYQFAWCAVHVVPDI